MSKLQVQLPAVTETRDQLSLWGETIQLDHLGYSVPLTLIYVSCIRCVLGKGYFGVPVLITHIESYSYP
jgi:hypothetical protein